MSQAQAFRVSSFGLLETDLTARVHPEKDLNGDACALIKVVMDKHFEFSGPLGIVKRLDKTAEIWLYVPAGTERLTISHPQWGMIRDYVLPMPLKGLTTYEMRLEAVKQTEEPSEAKQETSVTQQFAKQKVVAMHLIGIQRLSIIMPGTFRENFPVQRILHHILFCS
jgi:hypothetical protein